MSFTPFDVLTWMLIYLNYFVLAKIVVRDKTFRLGESIYIVFACFVMAASAVLGIAVLHVGGAISGIVSIVMCAIYFHKLKSYSIRKTITLVFLSIFISAISDSFAMLFADFFIPTFLTSIPNFPLPIGLGLGHFVRFVPYTLLSITVSSIATLLFIKVTIHQREHINKHNSAQTVLAVFSFCVLVVLVLVAGLWRYLGGAIEFLSWIAVPISGMAIMASISILFYARALNERMALHQKETEQNILSQYTAQIEEQQSIVTKLQHDIGNILSSMDGYIAGNDMEGLKEYFYAKVKVATAEITDNNMTIARLANIKVPEIKATLAAKLALAQSAGVETHFEAADIVDSIPINSVALVRMLGIIMDNAIEELVTIGYGKLLVACYVVGGGVTFVVQNTCRPNIHKLYELEQVGFSTKGPTRGLGLNNLAEIADTYPDNVTLLTSIKDESFTQKLRIGSGD